MSNPYRDVHALIRARRGRRWGTAALLILSTGAATVLAQPVLLGFLSVGVMPLGVEAVTFRLGALIAAAMALHTYSDLVRGADRPVLDPHPVQPRPLLVALAARTARERVYLPLMAAAMLSPIGWMGGDWRAWAGASAVALGAWLCALGVGYAVHLGALWAALSPGLSGLLEAIRGANPRMQAALIYAPGVALAAVGTAVGMAASGLAGALGGWTPGWAFLALPPLVGAAAWAAVPALADRYYVRATAILTEIDAQWAGAEEAEEASRVYLDWLAGADRPELLRALRHGWRRLRSWPLGGWGIGALAALAGWSDDPEGAARAMALAGAGALLMTAIPTRMAEGDPPWLDRALGISPARVAGARAGVAWLYAQGAILPPLLTLGLRQGGAAAALLLAVGEGLALLGAAGGAAAAMRLRGRGVWVYGPLALLTWATVVGSVQP